MGPSTRTGAGHRLYADRDVLREGDVRAALVRRLAQVDQDLAAATQQRAQLEQAIEELDMIEQKLNRRREEVGDERIAQVEQEWAELFAQLEEHRVRGTDPGDRAVRALTEKGDALFAEFHGGDPELVEHASRVWHEGDPAEVSSGMVSAELWDYYGAVQRARDAGPSA